MIFDISLASHCNLKNFITSKEKNMKLKQKLLGAAGVLALAAQNAMAETSAVDYSTLTSAVNFTDIIAALMGVAVIVVGFILVKNNIKTIWNFIRGVRP